MNYKALLLMVFSFGFLHAFDREVCRRDRGNMNVYVLATAPESFDEPLDMVIKIIRKKLLFPFRRKKPEYRHMTLGYYIIGDVKRDKESIDTIAKEVYRIAREHIKQSHAEAHFHAIEIWKNYIVATFEPQESFITFEKQLYDSIKRRFPKAIPMYIERRRPHISLSNKFDRLTVRQVAAAGLVDTVIPLPQVISSSPSPKKFDWVAVEQFADKLVDMILCTLNGSSCPVLQKQFNRTPARSMRFGQPTYKSPSLEGPVKIPPFIIDSSLVDSIEISVGDEDCGESLLTYPLVKDGNNDGKIHGRA